MNADNTDRQVDMQRALNRCVARTLVELRRSVRRNRTIPLPALLRLFNRRWSEVDPESRYNELALGGLDTVHGYYKQHQPFSMPDD